MRKLICLLVMLLLLLFSLTGCFENKQDEVLNSDWFDDIVLDKDLVKISTLNSLIKIDSISAGLDTYTFDTILFDLENGDELCQVSFSEGAWLSSLTENGFYVIDTLKKELEIYDKVGKIAKQYDFSSVVEPMDFCALSENERFFVCSNASGTMLTVIDLSENAQNHVELQSPLLETLSFEEDILRAVSIDGQVFEIDVKDSSCTFVLQDSRIKLFSSRYCLGETETNFLIANEDACVYIPISSVDEIVVGMGENRFATTSLSDNKHTLRFYDVDQKSVSYFYTDEPVESVWYTDDEKMLAVIGSSMEKQHKIIVCSPEQTEEITVLYQDTPINTNTDIPSSEEMVSTPKKLIESVPVIAQLPMYPTGCESVTAVMALQYSGHDITVDEFIDNLPTNREFYIDGGKNYGPSPYEYFIGSPKSPASYGCMSPVIQKALTQYLGDSNKIKNLTNTELSDICEQYINNDIPVIMWATIDMREINHINSWYLTDGTHFIWPGNEHCMLLIGYDDENYYFNDPYEGQVVAYEKALTEARFADLGKQALAILP
ncbi:MAG: C39 family peptidase [Clostridia bacterium]|nr:C39 family peptidase [Clostridia bacterium]